MKRKIEDALTRISEHIHKTPCQRSEALSQRVGGDVSLKLENLQVSGSFKLRGVVNKLLSLSEEEKQQELVAASTGNHGLAFAFAIENFNLRGRLFLPETINAIKLEALEKTGMRLEFVGRDCVEAEVFAAKYVAERDAVGVPPYNDWDIIAGQGTVGVELVQQMEKIDAVLVPVGGGGLISGISAYLKAISPKTEIIGCQPVNSAIMHDSIKAGQIVVSQSLPTLSDATAGGIEPDSVTFDCCQKYVDDFILLEEEEITNAIRLMYERENQKIEGGAALSIAAAIKQPTRFRGRHVVLIISGSRIEDSFFENSEGEHDPDHRP